MLAGEAGLLQLRDELERLTHHTPIGQRGSSSPGIRSSASEEQPLVLVVACVTSLPDLAPLVRRTFTHEARLPAVFSCLMLDPNLVNLHLMQMKHAGIDRQILKRIHLSRLGSARPWGGGRGEWKLFASGFAS